MTTTQETISDAEVINSMTAFCVAGCDEAANKWASGKYSKNDGSPDDHATRREGYYRWEGIKTRMREMLRELKERKAT